MSFSLFKLLNGLLVREAGTLSPKEIVVIPGGTSSTRTTVVSSQTTDKTITLPDATDTLVGKATTDTLTNKSIDGLTNTLTNIPNSALASNIDATKIADGSVSNTEFQYLDGVTSSIQTQLDSKASAATGVTLAGVQTLTNKTIDADSNTITNIDDNEIKANAGINATKIANGNVSNAEFQYLDGVTSPIQTQLDAKAPAATTVDLSSGQTLSNKSLVDTTTSIVDSVDSTKKILFDAAGSGNTSTTIASSQSVNRIITLPDISDTVVTRTNQETLSGKQIQYSVLTDSTTTGSNATIGAFTTGVVRLTNASLVSLSGIPAGSAGQALIIENKTGVQISVNNDDSGASASARIFTGTNATVSMPINASFSFVYDLTASRWQLVGGTGSGSSTSINYITNGDAETGTTGWATYADAAGTSPVDGTGGSPTVTFTTSTSSPLRGTTSFLFTKTATNTQGQGVSYDFTIDNAAKAKVISVSFDFIVNSGTFVAGSMSDRTSAGDSDLTVWLYDVTNATIIQPSTYRLYSNSSTISANFSGYFQTASNSTSYRLILHSGTTNASAFVLKVDNFVVAPSVYVYGSPITDWVSWTPTGTWTTNATYTGRRRRVGDCEEFDGQVSLSGAPNATTLSINLPVTIDTTKLTNGSYSKFSRATADDTGNSSYPGFTIINSSTVIQPLVQNASSTYATNNSITATSPFTFGNTDTVTFFIQVPVVGYSSSVQMSDSADTRVCVATYVMPSTQSFANTTFTTMLPTSRLVDTHGAFNTSTGLFTVPVSGFYRTIAYINLIGATVNTGEIVLQLLVNGSGANVFARTPIGNSSNPGINGSFINYYSAGTTIGVSFYQSNGATRTNETNNMFLSFEKVTGPSAIAATETIACKYTNTSGATVTNNTNQTVTGWVKAFDTHNIASTSGVITIPAAGKYMTTATATYAAGFTANTGNFNIYIVQSGSSSIGASNQTSFGSFTTGLTASSTTSIFNCLAGDTITINLFQSNGASRALATDASGCHFEVYRIGL